MTRNVEIDVDAIILRPRSARYANADSIVDRSCCADQGASGRAGGDVQAVDPQRLAQPLECVAVARKGRNRVRQLDCLEGRQAARRPLEQNAG